MNQLNTNKYVFTSPDTMRIDPYKSKDTYANWRRRTGDSIPGLTQDMSQPILQFLHDMEHGANIAKGSRKGGRSYVRLNTLRNKLIFLVKHFQERFELSSLVSVSEQQLHRFFTAMRNGDIRKSNGEPYRSTGDYVKIFKTFWHWHMKVQRKRGNHVGDICADLDDSQEKPPWVYLTEDHLALLCNHASYEYRVLITFLFDSGIRSPTELMNVRASDLSDDCTQLRIQDETSKTFGRTITLLLCPRLLQDYVQHKQLTPNDYLFPITPATVNRYLRRLATRLLGHKKSLGGSKYSELTMYDFRHSAACYWLPRYKSESALKYRFGWRKSDMIYYYSELVGMVDTITESDLCVEVHRTKLERRLGTAEADKRRLEEQLHALQQDMNQILTVVEGLVRKVG